MIICSKQSDSKEPPNINLGHRWQFWPPLHTRWECERGCQGDECRRIALPCHWWNRLLYFLGPGPRENHFGNKRKSLYRHYGRLLTLCVWMPQQRRNQAFMLERLVSRRFSKPSTLVFSGLLERIFVWFQGTDGEETRFSFWDVFAQTYKSQETRGIPSFTLKHRKRDNC